APSDAVSALFFMSSQERRNAASAGRGSLTAQSGKAAKVTGVSFSGPATGGLVSHHTRTAATGTTMKRKKVAINRGRFMPYGSSPEVAISVQLGSRARVSREKVHTSATSRTDFASPSTSAPDSS